MCMSDESSNVGAHYMSDTDIPLRRIFFASFMVVFVNMMMGIHLRTMTLLVGLGGVGCISGTDCVIIG